MTAAMGLEHGRERRGLAVSTHGLVHIYRSEGHDVAALAGVDLDVRAGEMVGLLGPSGAGKSTLLTLFGGLMRPERRPDPDRRSRPRRGWTRRPSTSTAPPTSGWSSRGRDATCCRTSPPATTSPSPRRPLAPPDGRCPPRARCSSWSGSTDAARPPSSTMTPGRLQLTALAVAISTLPGLLLADEPTSQLDHEARDLVLDRLHEVNRQVGTTVVLVTHDADVAARLPRTVTIRDGRVGGEGRRGEEYAVVSADGSLPLPDDVLDDLPPGTLVRVHREGDRWTLITGEGAERD